MEAHRPITRKVPAALHLLRALRHRNYRLFFGGQGISLIGSWMTRIATSWLVYRFTHSALLLGVVGFAGQVPTLVLSPMAGVLVDRWDRHRILVITQILSMAQSFALAWLALAGIITVHQVIWLSVFQGVVNAFDIPARQSLVIELVENPNDLSNAIALNSSIFNGARLIGPSIAGLLIASVGEGFCFLIDGISYLAVIAALLAMRLSRKNAPPNPHPVLHQLIEGLRYAANIKPIRSILLLVALVSLVGMPYAVLLPVVAREILRGGAHTYGFLMGVSGLGALTGALYLASRKNVLGLEQIIALAAGGFSVGLMAFACSRILWLSMVCMALVGGGMLMQMAASNTLLQTLVDDDKRGRIMSLYAMAFMGMTPFGSLLAGGLATRIGAPATLLLSGAICALGVIRFARGLITWPHVTRPIYVKKGLLPDVTASA